MVKKLGLAAAFLTAALIFTPHSAQAKWYVYYGPPPAYGWAPYYYQGYYPGPYPGYYYPGYAYPGFYPGWHYYYYHHVHSVICNRCGDPLTERRFQFDTPSGNQC